MIELIINGFFIGLGTAIGTPIGIFVYETKIKPYLSHYTTLEEAVRGAVKKGFTFEPEKVKKVSK